MASPVIRPQLILDYTHFFNEEPPVDRLEMVSQIGRKQLLVEIAGLNYKLKPKNQFQIDDTFDTQVKLLEHFTADDFVFRKYSRVTQKFTSDTSYPLIFTRQACLFAIEEIINSDQITENEAFIFDSAEKWESILKYFLSVNYVITQIKQEVNEDDINFETLNPKLIPLNELNIETDPIFTIYRGYRLITYIINNETYSKLLINYLLDTYSIGPEEFILNIMRMYIANKFENPVFDFYYQIPEHESNIFDKLSVRFPNRETFKLLNIRKSPFIKIDNFEYIISDNTFLLEKSYSQLLNDFWFDRLRNEKNDEGINVFKISNYRSVFGYFFESYVSEILLNAFSNYKYSSLLMFDQLKVRFKDAELEIADVYFRNSNKILLGQVKSGNIYDNEKYAGDVLKFYKEDRPGFFKNFGIDQLFTSLDNMDRHILQLDNKFPSGKTYHVYPCIIVNDKAFQTPLMADIFNKRFQELMENFCSKNVRVKPLTLIHISDIEKIEGLLNKEPKRIWDLLEENLKNKKFIPPFYVTVDRYKTKNMYDRVMETYRQLLEKYKDII